MTMLLIPLLLQAATAGAAPPAMPPAPATEAPCPATAAALPAELAAWPGAQPMTAATTVEASGNALFTPGKAAVLALASTPDVKYAIRPENPGGSVSHGGIAAIEVARAGTYRVAIDSAAWIDVVGSGRSLEVRRPWSRAGLLGHSQDGRFSARARPLPAPGRRQWRAAHSRDRGGRPRRMTRAWGAAFAAGLLFVALAAIAAPSIDRAAEGPHRPGPPPVLRCRSVAGRQHVLRHLPWPAARFRGRQSLASRRDRGIGPAQCAGPRQCRPPQGADLGRQFAQDAGGAVSSCPSQARIRSRWAWQGKRPSWRGGSPPMPVIARCSARPFRRRKGAIGMSTIARAVAAFERSMVSADAPIDRIGAGGALPAQARAGQAIFKRDCAACHKGPDFTDDRFHRVADLPPGAADRGLAEVTGRRADDGKFRTPSLRNVALGAPYFHDGGAPTLDDAIRRHGGDRSQAGRGEGSRGVSRSDDRPDIRQRPALRLSGRALRGELAS